MNPSPSSGTCVLAGLKPRLHLGLLAAAFGVATPLVAQTCTLTGGVLAPFGETKSRALDAPATAYGPRSDAFSNGFSLQASVIFPSDGWLQGRGTAGICGMNGTSTGSQRLDLQFLAYGLAAGWQANLGPPSARRSLYAFSELRFDWEYFTAKTPGSGWLGWGPGSRRCLRLGLGAGLGWIHPTTGFTLEAEIRTSLSGPISSSADAQNAGGFWASLPPDRYVRVGVGWTSGAGRNRWIP
jgi:hypothetical protein